jgi:hypothetical protein
MTAWLATWRSTEVSDATLESRSPGVWVRIAGTVSRSTWRTSPTRPVSVTPSAARRTR